jgi:hypothetical protein
LDSKIIQSILIHLIPAAVSYCGICDGDARVIIMFALRKLIPTLSQSYYQSRELRAIFVEKILSYLPISQLLQDHSPVPQYMIRLLSEICGACDNSCQDLTRTLIKKHKQTQENILQILFQLLRANPIAEKHSSTPPSSRVAQQEINPSDPQIIILLRQLLSSNSSEFFSIVIQEGISPLLASSVNFAIQAMNSEHLLVTLELLITFLSLSRNEIQKNGKNETNFITTSSLLTNLEVNLRSMIVPMFGVLLWSLSDDRYPLNVDSSVLFLIHDCALKSLLQLVDLIPDLLVEVLLQDKQSSKRFYRILINDQVSLNLVILFHF